MSLRAASHVALYIANLYFLVSMHDVENVWPVWCNACVSDSSCLNLATVFTSQDLSHSSFLFCCLALHMLLFCNLDLFRFVRNSWFVCVAFASAFFVCSRCVFVTPFLMFVNFPRCQVRCLCHNFGPAWTTWYHTFWRLGGLQTVFKQLQEQVDDQNCISNSTSVSVNGSTFAEHSREIDVYGDAPFALWLFHWLALADGFILVFKLVQFVRYWPIIPNTPRTWNSEP